MLKVSALVALGLAGAWVLVSCGYSRSDHTTGRVRILNDGTRTLSAALCDHESCKAGGFHNETELKPGSEEPVSVSTLGIPSVHLIRDVKTGRTLGCLPLVMPRYVSGLVARVSAAKPCRSNYDEHVQWPTG